MNKSFDNLISLVGNTPLVKMNFLSQNSEVDIYAKLEGNNPAGSVKDRPAKYMFLKGLESGAIDKSTQLIEPTSGNTGIALAMIASSLRMSLTLVMPESATIERVKTMKAYGSEVVLTSKKGSMEEAIDYAKKKVAVEGYFMLNQFANSHNPLAHYETTGPEIWRDTDKKITHFVSAMGTTGTIMGVSRYLKEKKPSIKIIGAEPSDGSSIPGIRKWPKEYLPQIYDSSRVDEVISVSETKARVFAKKLAKEEALLSGMSTGGAAYIAHQVSGKIKKGLIVFIACDRGDRYLSSDLFD